MTTEFSMRQTATSGQGGIVRWRRHSSRSIADKLGLCIDVGKILIGGPQMYLLIGGTIADGGFRLGWHLHAGGQQSVG